MVVLVTLRVMGDRSVGTMRPWASSTSTTGWFAVEKGMPDWKVVPVVVSAGRLVKTNWVAMVPTLLVWAEEASG